MFGRIQKIMLVVQQNLGSGIFQMYHMISSRLNFKANVSCDYIDQDF